jgi:Domain of unknown function (DUF6285)
MSTHHDPPTIDELLEAVVEYLRDDLFDVTPEDQRFHLRVAISVLGIVRRELALGPGQRRAHQERLRALGVTDDADLARRIRSGDLDAPAVRSAVLESVVDKLRVANPRYLEEQ